MREYGVLLYGFADRKFIILRRYPLNFLGSMLTYLLVFLMVYWGGRAIAPDEFGQTVDALIVGYFLLSTSLSTFFSLSGMIHSEAQYGTLEQLYISPFRFSTVMFAAVLANIVISVGLSVVNLAIVLAVTGESLTIDLVTILPLFGLTLLHAIGFSFFLGGFALLYKRIRSLFNIIQFFFIVFISFALGGRLWARLLPIGQGAYMLRDAMSNGRQLWTFPMADHAILVGTSVVYLSFGYAMFHLAQNVARQRGLLDDY